MLASVPVDRDALEPEPLARRAVNTSNLSRVNSIAADRVYKETG
jgi:hypothetical protein